MYLFLRTYHKAQLSQAEDLSEELRRRGGGADAQSLALVAYRGIVFRVLGFRPAIFCCVGFRDLGFTGYLGLLGCV